MGRESKGTKGARTQRTDGRGEVKEKKRSE